MISSSCFGRAIALGMALVIFIVSLPLGTAQAKLVATEQVVAETSAPSERERIIAYLMRAEVQAQMRDWGVDATEAAARVAALSDDEVSHISGRLDNLPAGEGVGFVVVAVVLLLVLVVVFKLQ